MIHLMLLTFITCSICRIQLYSLFVVAIGQGHEGDSLHSLVEVLVGGYIFII